MRRRCGLMVLAALAGGGSARASMTERKVKELKALEKSGSRTGGISRECQTKATSGRDEQFCKNALTGKIAYQSYW